MLQLSDEHDFPSVMLQRMISDNYHASLCASIYYYHCSKDALAIKTCHYLKFRFSSWSLIEYSAGSVRLVPRKAAPAPERDTITFLVMKLNVMKWRDYRWHDVLTRLEENAILFIIIISMMMTRRWLA